MALLQIFLLALAAYDLGLNVKDFGAVGDGVTDDTEAIQRAIDMSVNSTMWTSADGKGTAASAASRPPTAVLYGPRALLFPAGIYAVSRTLVVPCTVGADHSTVQSVRLVGEGMRETWLRATSPMLAVLFFNSTIPLRPAGKPEVVSITTNAHQVRGITFDAATLANYSVYAPAITRSSFRECTFTHSRLAGLRFGFGWINIVEDCRFYGNAATSLHMANNINNVNVLNNLFENNGGLGIVINGGVQVLVQGNVFESLAGPSVFARGVGSLKITANYFEANDFWEGHSMPPPLKFFDEVTGKQVTICAEIILDGAALPTPGYNIDSEDPYIFELNNISVGHSGPNTVAAVVSSNFHNPDHDSAAYNCTRLYTGVAATGAFNTIVEANMAGACGKISKDQICKVATGTNITKNFRIEMNAGWSDV